MDIKTLEQFGLNNTQAKAYLALVRNGSLAPPALAKLTNETRTNAYTVLDRLVELGLAKKDERNKKLIYHVENPVALEKLAKKHRDEALQREKQVKDSMPALLNFFYTFSEQPSIRFFKGLDGIKDMYDDMLRTRKDIYLLRSIHDDKLLSLDFYTQFKERRARLGIKTHMLNPSGDRAAWNKEGDKLYNLVRTQLPQGSYTAPVEMSVYGNKVALISFGEESIGLIIDSPQIAESMRQVFDLARTGAKTLTR